MWLDSKRSFGEHVARVAPKARRVANNLARLLPNIGGASGGARRLYVATVLSVLLYAAPIWWEKVGKSPHLSRQMAAAQRIIANKAARAYRTVSHVGAITFAAVSPVILISKSYAETYETVKEIRSRLGEVPARARRMLKLQTKETLLRNWEAFLANPQLAGRRVREAVQPVLAE
ncbi:uncharacterized protein [Temnothorax nylanderi]|uniref:uncharacterized protein n=1 Tax=Temnothorax nylanderi TaxID=102681 RepID=UPI003A8AC1B6